MGCNGIAGKRAEQRAFIVAAQHHAASLGDDLERQNEDVK
jgi:hypothetical protein